jgi:Protein of unknown function (DUF2917)
MSRNTTETVRTVDLDHEQLLILDNRAGARIRVLSGGTWLTEQGRMDDVHVRPGNAITLSTRGRTVLEGLGRARIEVVLPATAGWISRLAQATEAWPRSLVPLSLRGGAVVLSLVLGLGLTDMVARGMQHAGAESAVHAG